MLKIGRKLSHLNKQKAAMNENKSDQHFLDNTKLRMKRGGWVVKEVAIMLTKSAYEVKDKY
jgi:hypothetical protein